MPGGSLKPKRSAVATSRLAPSLAPSGAKTELQDFAKDVDRACRRRTRRWRSPASTPSSVAAVWTGKVFAGLVTPASSAPVVVTILNVEPGRLQAREGDAGEGEHLAGARPHRDDAAEAPGQRGRPPPAGPAARSSCARRAPGAARGGEHARAGAQLAAGRAGSALVEHPLQAGDADLRRRRAAERAQLPRARSGGIGPSWPATCGAERARPTRGRRPWPAPCRRGPAASRARAVRVVAAQALAGAQPGEDEAAPSDRVARRRR